MDEAWLLWGLLFGSVGLGFLVYGRKQKAIVPFVCGLALMAFPYFVSTTTQMIVIGLLLIIACFVIKI